MKLYYSIINTPLGDMKAVGDDQFLYALEFVGSRSDLAVKNLQENGFAIFQGSSASIESVRKELSLYFTGELREFKTPVAYFGTDFQKVVWGQLQKISFGITKSYAELAEAVGNAKAFRAVANANGKNHLAIIVPCHRVINKSGKLGGYGGGVKNKSWLLNHELFFRS